MLNLVIIPSVKRRVHNQMEKIVSIRVKGGKEHE